MRGAPEDSTPYQVYVRYLDSLDAEQVTQLPEHAFPDRRGRRTTCASCSSARTRPRESGRFRPSAASRRASIPIETQAGDGVAGSADRRIRSPRRRPGLYGVWISSPPGARAPEVHARPDGHARALQRDSTALLARRQEPPAVHEGRSRRAMKRGSCRILPTRRIHRNSCCPNLPSYGGTPNFAWMPDSRRVVLSISVVAGGVAATLAGGSRFRTSGPQLTSGTTGHASARGVARRQPHRLHRGNRQITT